MVVTVTEARRNFVQLLDHVREGRVVTITKRRVPVANLVSFETPHVSAHAVISRRREVSVGTSLGGISIGELKAEGRKHWVSDCEKV